MHAWHACGIRHSTSLYRFPLFFALGCCVHYLVLDFNQYRFSHSSASSCADSVLNGGWNGGRADRSCGLFGIEFRLAAMLEKNEKYAKNQVYLLVREMDYGIFSNSKHELFWWSKRPKKFGNMMRTDGVCTQPQK